MATLPPAIFLMGPTAAGKTELALGLARSLPCELISVDSAMVYRGMDIGTAKPDAAVLAAYPHQLVDIRDPKDSYSAADFHADALAAMAAATGRGRIPLLVGGTMLYFRSLLQGLANMPSADAEVRRELEALMAEAGVAHLHRLLTEVDPISAERIHPNDPQRLVRALEVFRVTGRPLSEFHRGHQQGEDGRGNLPYAIISLAIAPPQRAVLHQRIEQRFLEMVRQGFVDEVSALHCRVDLHAALPAMRAVGYRQVWEYLDGNLSREEMIQRGIIATRQLAKRQLTWLRGWPQAVHWLDSQDSGNLSHALSYVS